MKAVKRISAAVLSLLIAIPVLFFGIGLFTPDPAAHLTRWAFGGIGDQAQGSYARIPEFSSLSEQVVVHRNEIYDPSSRFGRMDIYIPKDSVNRQKPVLFWVHGGAFVGGDKNGIADYMTMLASQGYIVANLNYELAPESEYPKPLLQIGEAYRYIEKNASRYGADMTRIALGGDSAGGQLIGQFANMQVDPGYAETIGIEPSIRPDAIKAVVFFSALLDVEKFDETDSGMSNYFFNKSAWAYFGKKNWKTSAEAKQSNITGNVNADYPPTYLTDGNTNSFQSHAEELRGQLEASDVPVEAAFYESELMHEYQFDMSKDESQDNYRRVSDFLARYLQ
ncbi:alpha/beta hydrolase [Saccharibacillus endophyticus]|uniref:Lipase n=1 Tax=Saccharibacillus endophyticus TaxID=2060666 RepID=A0ABQ1ZN91_9BACL|nr:alpha/beta hydrolase [Saccharibacillus endophyticus]GGH69597.1 lipase [Saccharibacillus endophyticus]